MLSYSPFTLIYYKVDLKFIGEYLLCSVVLACSKVARYTCVSIYPLFFGFPSQLGHHRALSTVPCAA